MATIITKELAEKIAKKLGATIDTTGPHAIAYIYHNEVLIAHFGIRHGSRKDAGHDHVPSDIHVSPGKARRLGQCPMSKAEWLECLREKNLLPAEEESE